FPSHSPGPATTRRSSAPGSAISSDPQKLYRREACGRRAPVAPIERRARAAFPLLAPPSPRLKNFSEPIASGGPPSFNSSNADETSCAEDMIMAITVYPVTPSFAAEIGDVDLAQPIDPMDLGAIKGAFTQYAVLIFPDQHLSQDQHLDFARHFGPLET